MTLFIHFYIRFLAFLCDNHLETNEMSVTSPAFSPNKIFTMFGHLVCSVFGMQYHFIFNISRFLCFLSPVMKNHFTKKKSYQWISSEKVYLWIINKFHLRFCVYNNNNNISQIVSTERRFEFKHHNLRLHFVYNNNIGYWPNAAMLHIEYDNRI